MAAQPQTTIIPFADLPPCAADCGPLLDANGACVPPVLPAVDEACFCGHSALSGFRSGTSGVCDDICPNGDREKTLVAIQNWFAETCDVEKASAEEDSSDSDSSSGSGSKSNSSDRAGQSWVQIHWRWLVMIIVLAIAIIAIWVAAFWWRRRHLRKKELKRSMGKNPSRSSWGPGAAPPPGVADGVFVPSVGGTPEPPRVG